MWAINKSFHDADEIHIFARKLVNTIQSSLYNCLHEGTVLKFVYIIFLKHSKFVSNLLWFQIEHNR